MYKRQVFRSGLVATEEGVVAGMAGVSLSPLASEKVKTNEYHRLYTALRVQPRQVLLSTAGLTTQHKRESIVSKYASWRCNGHFNTRTYIGRSIAPITDEHRPFLMRSAPERCAEASGYGLS